MRHVLNPIYHDYFQHWLFPMMPPILHGTHHMYLTPVTMLEMIILIMLLLVMQVLLVAVFTTDMPDDAE